MQKSVLISQVDSLESIFSNENEAINFFSEKLQQLCFRNGKSVEDFLLLAELNLTYNSDMLEALTLEKRIKFLREINERKTRLEYVRKLS